MGRRVICYIQAYDCEETIEAAMESVRSQTYDNWLCFVLSNGNGPVRGTLYNAQEKRWADRSPGNGSYDRIKAAASGDSRFIVLNKAYNCILSYFIMVYQLARCFPDSYICLLDADDIYKPDFFQRAVSLAEARDLDVVACGTEIVQKECAGAAEETQLSTRAIAEDLIVQGDDLNRLFPVYKPFFNEGWGKLYHSRLFGPGCDERYIRKNFLKRFLPDMLFTVDTLSRCTSVGILSGTSHKFYQYVRRTAQNGTAVTNVTVADHLRLFEKNRYSVYRTHDAVMTFLRAHGEVDGALYEYMQALLFGWIGDFFNRTLLYTQDGAKLAGHVERLVFHPKFDELMAYRGSGAYRNLKDFAQRKEFCLKLRNFLICQEVLRNRRLGPVVNLRCTAGTRKKLARAVEKLDRTIQMLSE